MQTYIVPYVASFLTLAILDAIWLPIAGKLFFNPVIGPILRDTPVWSAVVGFYLLYAVGICVFVLAPAMKGGSWQSVLMYGALFGFMVYMAYDFTNLATLQLWTARIAAIDILWGTFATAMASVAGYFAMKTAS